MSSGIYVALAGARAQSDGLDSTARNVANAGTSGYKAERMTFDKSLVAAQAPDQRYVKTDARHIDTSQGAISNTGNPLDLALNGKGFFAVSTDDGERYTRDGSFRIDSEGTLVTSMGHAVLDESGESITLPDDTADISVGAEGEVFAGDLAVGNLRLVDFSPDQIHRAGDNLFRSSGQPLEDFEPPEVVSESLEASNFNAVRGVVEIVKVTRTYQALLKMIEGYKETESRAARALGGPK